MPWLVLVAGRQVLEAKRVLNLETDPNLLTQFNHRADSHVLRKHYYVANVWNLDEVLVANSGETDVLDFTGAKRRSHCWMRGKGTGDSTDAALRSSDRAPAVTTVGDVLVTAEKRAD